LNLGGVFSHITEEIAATAQSYRVPVCDGSSTADHRKLSIKV